MARETFESWIIVEVGDTSIQALTKASATEMLARPENMTSDTKDVPRSGEFAVAGIAKGATYGATSGTNDYVELIARKVGGAIQIAEEDLMDSTVDIMATKRNDAARSMAKFFDNATLGCSATMNGTTVAYTSVYKAIQTNDSTIGYTAGDNYVSGSATYDNLSATLACVEDSDYFDAAEMVVISSPAIKQSLRNVRDTNGTPIFVLGTSGTPDTLFEYPIYWSQGCRVSATNTYAPTGNPLMIVVNKKLLIKGMAKLSPYIASPNPGFAVQRANNGIGFLSDSAYMKAAMRRGFALGAATGAAVFERTS